MVNILSGVNVFGNNWRDWETQSGFVTERDAKDYFLKAIGPSGFFDIHTEVHGEVQLKPYKWATYGTTTASVRLDALMIPTAKAVESGWHLGAWLVEFKRSHVGIGPPICQICDYLTTTYEVPGVGEKVIANYGFLFPAKPIYGGPLASFVSQNRAGTATVCEGEIASEDQNKKRLFSFYCGQSLIFNFYRDGSFGISKKEYKCGLKTGSR